MEDEADEEVSEDPYNVETDLEMDDEYQSEDTGPSDQRDSQGDQWRDDSDDSDDESDM